MENKQPLVSVVINCYNSDTYLKEAIDSVISQTYPNWEIIFWDNQSTDKSAEIVKSYNDERVKYFYASVHTPLGEARNLAIEKSRGVWIGILDCDDMWHNNKLEIQLENIDDSIGIIYSRAEFLIENTNIQSYMAKSIKKNYYPKIKNLPSGNIFDKLLYECFIPLPSVLIKKNLFIEVGGIDGTLKVAEDYDIFLKIANISNIISIDKILCTYRVHSNNLSHSNVDGTFNESMSLVNSYLPNYSAAKALLKWQLQYMKNLIWSGKYFHALKQLMRFNYFKIVRCLIDRKS